MFANIENTTFKIKPALSGNGGVFYNLHFGHNFVFGSELLFIQIEGQDRLEYEIHYSKDDIGHATSDLYEHISYLGLPIYCGFTIKNMTINAGFQLSYALARRGREALNINVNGAIYSDENRIDNLPIDKFDFGPRIGLTYNLNNKFSIEGVYYYGINNILENQDDSIFPLSHKIQQATIGLRYKIFKKDR